MDIDLKHLLNYNWCIILYMFCLTWWVFVSVYCENITTIKIVSTAIIPTPPPFSRQPLICFYHNILLCIFQNFIQMESNSTYSFSVWLFPLSIIILRLIPIVGFIKNLFLFYCWVVFHCMGMSYSYPFTCWWSSGLCTAFGSYQGSCHEHSHTVPCR